MTVDPLFKRITLVRYQLGDVPFSATGFFYSSGSDLFLVTNNHIFEHEFGVSPEDIEIDLRNVESPERTKQETIDTKSSDGEPKWVNHPKHPNADVSVLPLPNIDIGSVGNETFTSDDFIPAEDDSVAVGTEAMVTGYPTTGKYPIRDRETSTPVAVNAFISSSYGEYFDGEPFFVADAKTYDGMSGSPVLLRPGPQVFVDSELQSPVVRYRENNEFGFLGVHSGPYEVNQELSLNRVWYCDVVEEIIESI